MSQLESSIERRVKQWADAHGILNCKFTPVGTRGYPDRMFFVPGGFPLLLEFKKEGETPTKLQAYIIGKLKENGYDARWTDNSETAIGWLREALDTAKRAAQGRGAPAKKARGGNLRGAGSR